VIEGGIGVGKIARVRRSSGESECGGEKKV
jgi:hypothetical protein